MSKKRFMPNWWGLWRFMRDPKSDWKPKVAVGIAIVYLIWPIDLIPDFVPIIGWLDDIGITTLAVAYLLYASNRYLDDKQAGDQASKLIEQKPL